jgi:hypothetical protein
MKLSLSLALLILVSCASSSSSPSSSSSSSSEKSKPHKVERPPIVPASAWESTPQPMADSRKHTPKYVTIHHAGVEYKVGTDPVKFVKNMQIWGQRDKKWPDVPYHFLIAPDGRIIEGRSMEYEPDTNTRYELQGHIGVEMMGSFQSQRVSPQQLDSIVKLVAWICQEKNIPIDAISGHNDVAPNQTTCPGKDFYRYLKDGQFKKWVKLTMEGKDPQIDPGPPLPGGPTIIVGQAPPATTQTAR